LLLSVWRPVGQTSLELVNVIEELAAITDVEQPRPIVLNGSLPPIRNPLALGMSGRFDSRTLVNDLKDWRLTGFKHFPNPSMNRKLRASASILAVLLETLLRVLADSDVSHWSVGVSA
jgi:hypothetical protein